jgi:hypothetical protein
MLAVSTGGPNRMSVLSPEKALIFRITHIDNVAWLLKNGLHCGSADVLDPNYHSIGNPDLIAKRASRVVPIPPGGTLGDYIPFYFTPYSPMLLNIKTGRHGIKKTPMPEIVILVSSLPALARQGIPFVFTDRHAYLRTADDAFSSDLADLKRVDWGLLRSRDFKRDPNDPGKFERYQAEALVHRHLPVRALLGIACHGEAQKNWLDNLLQKEGLTLSVVVRRGWYFS